MNIKKFIPIIILTTIFLSPSLTYAFDISVGGMSWYTWWKPFWEKEASYAQKLKIEVDPDFLSGPMLSIGFAKNWSISSLLLLGTYNVKGKGIVPFGAAPIFAITKVTRYDSDSTLHYSFTKYFKTFLGFKYTNYRYNYYNYISTSINTAKNIDKKLFNEYCPGLGIGITVPLFEQLYFLIHTSLVLCIGIEKSKGSGIIASSTGIRFSYTSFRTAGTSTNRIIRLGSNSALSFAYWIPQIKTTFSLGFRCQILTMLYKSNYVKNFTSSTDYIYGFQASAIYKFDI